VTFALGPFRVTSPVGPTGSPVAPTYLAIYLTGLNLTASPQVTIGGVQVPVVYFGNAPCCAGLEQINVQLVPQLAGAGRVPVVVTAAGVTSNVVQVTILPNSNSTTPAPQTVPNLTGVVTIPNTKLGLVVNATANTVRVVNTSTRVITATIPLPAGAGAGRIAVNSAGTLAVVVEHNLNAIAILNLSTNKVIGQANVGRGPVSVAIVGNRAFVVNQDSDSVTVLDLSSLVPVATIAVGRAPSSISVDTARNRLLITNTSSGTVSVIDLTSLKVTSTVPLTSNSRPMSVRVLSSLDLAVLTDATLKPGQILLIDLNNDTTQTININHTEMGSWTAAAVSGNKVFLTDSVDGEVAIVTFSRDSKKQIAQKTQIVNVQPGVQRLDVDADQNLLIIAQSNGKLMIFDLTTNKTIADVDTDD
jgi:YVTN family beta-propeller protein